MRLIISLCLISLSFAQVKTVAAFTKGMKKSAGFYTTYYDAKKGEIYLAVSTLNAPFIYVNSLPAGVGSNDIGLDRGQLGGTHLVQFERHGAKIFLKQINTNYRAVSNNALERRSVEQAFAQAVLWGFKIEAESKNTVLINLTPFLLRDAHGVARTLRSQNQGSLSLDASRSALFMERTKNFPNNSEFEATITFKGDVRGGELRSVTPSGTAVTVRMHHSFIKRPDKNYSARAGHPNSGMIQDSYHDYATPVDKPLVKRHIYRHRLEKKDPNAALSEAVEPIVYYVDNGAPEPIRSALIDGAKWWNDAFEAIGFKNAFQVKLLPADADPMDVRYNVIQWVHRKTRGWSYGSWVADPETGEIIKGHVSLGSLRIRQDFMIAQGLLSPFASKGADTSPMMEMALARIRQLSAHEVGHTIGVAHNFAASVANRASVMDYPHPLIQLKDEKIDLGDAYDVGIGDWDKVAVAYAYGIPKNGQSEEAMLSGVLEKAKADGLQFISDADARPWGGLHPAAHLWDNGADAASELRRILDVREFALRNFSEKNIDFGQPLSSLENVLVPMYFLHRYQAEAAVKLLGGMHYSYAIRGEDRQYANRIVAAKVQRDALSALIETISARRLAMPTHILDLIPPAAYSYWRDREQFRIKTGLNLDAISIAESASREVLRLVLNSSRINRLVEFHARDNKNPSLAYVLTQLTKGTWKKNQSKKYHKEIQDAINAVYLTELMNAAMSTSVSTKGRALIYAEIQSIKKICADTDDVNDNKKAFLNFMMAKIKVFERRFEDVLKAEPLRLPPGSPIGQ